MFYQALNKTVNSSSPFFFKNYSNVSESADFFTLYSFDFIFFVYNSTCLTAPPLCVPHFRQRVADWQVLFVSVYKLSAGKVNRDINELLNHICVVETCRVSKWCIQKGSNLANTLHGKCTVCFFKTCAVIVVDRCMKI